MWADYHPQMIGILNHQPSLVKLGHFPWVQPDNSPHQLTDPSAIGCNLYFFTCKNRENHINQKSKEAQDSLQLKTHASNHPKSSLSLLRKRHKSARRPCPSHARPMPVPVLSSCAAATRTALMLAAETSGSRAWSRSAQSLKYSRTKAPAPAARPQLWEVPLLGAVKTRGTIAIHLPGSFGHR